jgi:hypothetical protein
LPNPKKNQVYCVNRLSAGEKKADEEEKKRKQNEFGSKQNPEYESNNNFDYFRHRSRTPGLGNNSIMSRSAHEYYRQAHSYWLITI